MVEYEALARAEREASDLFPLADEVKALPTNQGADVCVEVWKYGRAKVLRFQPDGRCTITREDAAFLMPDAVLLAA